MNALNWNVEYCAKGTSSLTDVRNKLFPPKKEEYSTLLAGKDKYTPRTLVGNWFERRATSVLHSNDWRTIYKKDFRCHENKTWMPNQSAKWSNKLLCEGLPQELLFHLKKEYSSNMTTSSDLFYNILPKEKPELRSYNARKRKWVPEQDLTKSFGSLTQFGLKDEIEEGYRNLKEGITKCRWVTTYRKEIGELQPVKTERNTQFNRRIVDFNVPDLRHFERKSRNLEECLFPLKLKS